MDERQRQKGNLGDEVKEGLRAGLGILSALKDAVEETVEDMFDRGEISQERAREAVRTTMDRAQSAFEEARMRVDFVTRREYEALQTDLADIRRRIAALEARQAGGTGGRPGTEDGPDIHVSEG